MVSFFGLKIGGDKKKKQQQQQQQDRPEPTKLRKQPVDFKTDGQHWGTPLSKHDMLLLDGVDALPRPGTASSSRSFGFKRPKAPYAQGAASSSMGDLSSGPGAPWHSSSTSISGGTHAKVKTFGSDANLSTEWKNDSLTSLQPPSKSATAPVNGSPRSTGVSLDDRPGTSGSMTTSKSKQWAGSFDNPFSRDPTSSTLQRPSTSAGVTAPRPATSSGLHTSSPISAEPPQLPKSPLGQFEFNLTPLGVEKQPSTPEPELEPVSAQPKERSDSPQTTSLRDASPLRKVTSYSPTKITAYPSPPPSIKDLERPKMLVDTDLRPPSRQREGSVTSNGSQRSGRTAHHGPTALPSPAASLPRSSEDRAWTGPAIRDVRARRDTMTVKQPRKMSVSTAYEEPSKAQLSQPESAKIETVTPLADDPDMGFIFSLDSRAGTPRGGSPPPPPAPSSSTTATKDTTLKPPPPMSQREFIPYRPPGHAKASTPTTSKQPAPSPALSKDGSAQTIKQTTLTPAATGLTTPLASPRSHPEGHFRMKNDRADHDAALEVEPLRIPSKEKTQGNNVSTPTTTTTIVENVPLGDPDHPSKGPQDFNRRPAGSFSSNRKSQGVSRRPPPPQLAPASLPTPISAPTSAPASAPALARSQHELESPLSGAPLFPKTQAEGNFSAPRPAPCPRSAGGPQQQHLTAPQVVHQASAPPSEASPSHENLRQPPPSPGPSPAHKGLPTTALPVPSPSFDSNPNWPLVDSGPPSATFAASVTTADGNSLPASPMNTSMQGGGPLASPAFGTFALGNGGSTAGPSHWAQPEQAEICYADAEDDDLLRPSAADDSRSRYAPHFVEREASPSPVSAAAGPPGAPAPSSGPVHPPRPDFGLRAPTGIADEFRVGFI